MRCLPLHWFYMRGVLKEDSIHVCRQKKLATCSAAVMALLVIIIALCTYFDLVFGLHHTHAMFFFICGILGIFTMAWYAARQGHLLMRWAIVLFCESFAVFMSLSGGCQTCLFGQGANHIYGLVGSLLFCLIGGSLRSVRIVFILHELIASSSSCWSM